MSGVAAERLPRNLVVLVSAMAALAAALIGMALVHPGWHHPPSPVALLVSATAFVLGDLLLLHLRVGRAQYSFTWAELAVVIGLVVLPSPWLRLVATGSVGLAHVIARRPPVKIIFNASSLCVGVQLARWTANTVAAPSVQHSPVTPRAWAALSLASLVFFLWNLVTISWAVAASQRMPFSAVIRRNLAMSLVVFAGNTALGVVLVAVAANGIGNLLAVPPFVVLLFLTYRGYLRAIEERDTWELMQSISSRLVSVSEADVIRVAETDGPRLLRAVRIELELGSGRSAIDVGEAIVECRVLSTRELTLVAPLISRGERVGQLKAFYTGRRRLRARDQDLFSTFANHVSSALVSAQLFEETHREREKLTTVVESSSDGIAAVDSNGHVTAWNAAMERLTGRLAVDAIGAPLDFGRGALTESGEDVSVAWLMDRLARDGAFEAAVSTGGGTEQLWLSLAASPVAEMAGGAAAVLVTRDITARRELDDAKQAFVATVSHELRTPLTPLKGFLLTLMRPGIRLDSDQVSAIYDRMLGQAERLERLIEDLLSVSQIERGLFTVHSEGVDLTALIDATLLTAPATVSFGRPRDQLQVSADPVRLEQVLNNLLSNAAKYAGVDSPIGIKVEDGEHEVVVSVTDQGPGIPEDQQQTIFERFRRLGNHMTQAASGAGLGLYIARHLVEEMGGRIWVESGVGRGACFRFSLPKVAPSSKAEPVQPLRLARSAVA